MKQPPETAQRGVALIAVLWLVAAMSLITAGIVQSVRTEIRAVGLQRHAVIANGLADAAILLALQTLHAQQQEPSTSMRLVPVQFEGVAYTVSVWPLNGLIDLNQAAPALLADMYQYAGGLNPEAALARAQATIATRQLASDKGVARGFGAVEDLLTVPGMTYDLYAKLSGLVTADLKGGSGRVNPMAAPPGVLVVLVGGNLARAADLAAKRDVDSTVMDTSFFKPEFIELASTRSLEVLVNVDLFSGAAMQKVWHVYWGTDPRTRLPWRQLWSQQSIKPLAKSAY